MNKHFSAVLSAVATVAAVLFSPADAAPVQNFTGPFAPANWQTVQTGNVGGGGVTFTSTLLTIVGQDDPTVDPDSGVPACTGFNDGDATGPCQIGRSISLPGLTNFVFNWTYSTADSGGPGFDVFGYVADGLFHALSDLGGALTQSGTAFISASQSLAFVVNCRDCVGGAATGTVGAFATVPEPETFALLGLGVVAFAASRGRRRLPHALAPA
jgi:hypothetical protein